MSRIVRIMGYSPRKDEESNPVLKDFTRAFRNYRAKSRTKPMKPDKFDYVIFFLIVSGILLIFLSFFGAGFFGIVGGVMVAIAFLFEIVLLPLR